MLVIRAGLRGLLNNTAMVGELTYLSAGDMYGLMNFIVLEDPNDDHTELSCTISALGYVDIIRIPLPSGKSVFPNLERPPETQFSKIQGSVTEDARVGDW